MSGMSTTYHALIDDSGEVLILLRLRTTGDSTDGERYQPGDGWVRDNRAFDVMLNGQDYDVVDEDMANELAASMED